MRCLSSGLMHFREITWNVDGRTWVEVLREEVGIKSGTHQNDLQVWSLYDQVLQHQQQEVTGGYQRQRGQHTKAQLKMHEDKNVQTSPLFARAPRPRWRAWRLWGRARPPVSSAARRWCSTAAWWLTTNREQRAELLRRILATFHQKTPTLNLQVVFQTHLHINDNEKQ